MMEFLTKQLTIITVQCKEIIVLLFHIGGRSKPAEIISSIFGRCRHLNLIYRKINVRKQHSNTTTILTRTHRASHTYSMCSVAWLERDACVPPPAPLTSRIASCKPRHFVQPVGSLKFCSTWFSRFDRSVTDDLNLLLFFVNYQL